MAGEIRVGTSGWHYPGGKGTWNGIFYPKPRPRGFDELRFYAERFNTVEVNATFYRQPEAGMSRQWLDRTPESFLFSIKLFQKFTHPDMWTKATSNLSNEPPGPSETDAMNKWNVTLGDVDMFRAGLEPIAQDGRLGALLIQFPSSFHATPETQDYVLWLLAAFRDYPRAVEFRHKSWTEQSDETMSLLDEHRAALVEIDEPFAQLSGSVSREQLSRVPLREPVATSRPALTASRSSLAYIRLHGRNKAQWWEHAAAEDRYNYSYSAEELSPIADIAREQAALEKRVLVYFNNHFSAKAVANADILKNQIGEIAPDWQLRP